VTVLLTGLGVAATTFGAVTGGAVAVTGAAIAAAGVGAAIPGAGAGAGAAILSAEEESAIFDGWDAMPG